MHLTLSEHQVGSYELTNTQIDINPLRRNLCTIIKLTSSFSVEYRQKHNETSLNFTRVFSANQNKRQHNSNKAKPTKSKAENKKRNKGKGSPPEPIEQGIPQTHLEKTELWRNEAVESVTCSDENVEEAKQLEKQKETNSFAQGKESILRKLLSVRFQVLFFFL